MRGVELRSRRLAPHQRRLREERQEALHPLPVDRRRARRRWPRASATGSKTTARVPSQTLRHPSDRGRATCRTRCRIQSESWSLAFGFASRWSITPSRATPCSAPSSRSAPSWRSSGDRLERLAAGQREQAAPRIPRPRRAGARARRPPPAPYGRRPPARSACSGSSPGRRAACRASSSLRTTYLPSPSSTKGSRRSSGGRSASVSRTPRRRWSRRAVGLAKKRRKPSRSTLALLRRHIGQPPLEEATRRLGRDRRTRLAAHSSVE